MRREGNTLFPKNVEGVVVYGRDSVERIESATLARTRGGAWIALQDAVDEEML